MNDLNNALGDYLQVKGKQFQHGRIQKETRVPDPGNKQVAICFHRNSGRDIPRGSRHIRPSVKYVDVLKKRCKDLA